MTHSAIKVEAKTETMAEAKTRSLSDVSDGVGLD